MSPSIRQPTSTLPLALCRGDSSGTGLGFNQAALLKDIGAFVVQDPGLKQFVDRIAGFGRPVIAGTGIPVSSIYERYKAGDSVAGLAQDFRLDISAIEEAIHCEAA